MIRGITPIDGAFELMGLHQAQVLMRFIFLETMAGKVIFALGFLLSLKAGMGQSNFRPMFIFLMMFFSLWLLVVVPRVRVVDPVSSMERSGYQVITTAQVLKKNGYGEVMVSPVPDIISRMIDSLVISMAAVLERGDGGRGYVASPFLFTKVSILTQRIVGRGITDPYLEERAVHFYQDHFWPAVKSLGSKADDLWPGHPDVVRAYSEEGRAQWLALRETLYQACDQDKVFSRMFARFYDGKSDLDAVVRSLLAHEAALNPQPYTSMAYASKPGSFVRRIDPINIALPEKIMTALAFMQGGSLFLLWSLLPVFLAVVFLSRQIAPLVLFLSILFSLKAWTLVWAICDKISTVWFGVHQAWGGAGLWEQPVLNMFIASAAGILPLAMTAVVIFLSGRIKVEGKI